MNKDGLKKVKAFLLTLLFISVSLFSSGCESSNWEYDPITDVNDLEGRKVGVNLSWESDYYLTGRKDMELHRYDTTADLLLALKYDKIDVIALDIDTIKLIMAISDGVEVVEPAFGVVGSIMYFGTDDEALTEEFNDYLAEYKKTADYADLLKRLDEFDGTEYLSPDSAIPLTGSGKTIRVALDPSYFPRAFLNPGEDTPIGYDLEILKHFANDRNYKLDFIYSNYDDGLIGLQNGMYDIMTGYISDIFNEEAHNIGLHTCDKMFDFPLYFIQKYKQDIESDTSYLE